MASINQNNDFSVANGEIHSIPFRDENAHFKHFLSNIFDVSKITQTSANDSSFNRTDSLPVFEFRHPFNKGFSSSDFVFHGYIVAYGRQVRNQPVVLINREAI